ncbi:hypothetical protein EC12264_2853 [Escherichia coli 1.2264]|nr:hypothetical protein EC12264_2853 [Escherichia coli 1.2264]
MSKISRQSTRDGPFGQVVFALLLVQKRWYCARSSIRWLTLREQRMKCRLGCGACCTAPSISSPIPGMPDGKPANTPCIQLDEQQRCKIFTSPLRPKVCAGLQASAEMCGNSRQQAMTWLIDLEMLTAP